MWKTLLLLAVLRPPFEDRTFESKVFQQPRNYRLFLPSDYGGSSRRYPVIYYFHGHSDRYTLERYDSGKDTVPKILDFVARHPVIVVAVDGYVPETYTGFYGGSPWDIMQESAGSYDFGEHFKEIVAHIDSTLRTLPDRRHRGTSGLSMGGFMSLYLSARYPQLLGSASSFNPGPEFYVGDKGRRLLWRPKDHLRNHTHTMIRLIRASGDYISQYHEETREAYARETEVTFEYRQDEYHRHWATSIAETFAFHMRAFETRSLDNVPETFHHTSAFDKFNVWGWEVSGAGDPAFTCLTDVSQTGLRVVTRQWAPDGPPVPTRRITITTPALYQASASYTILDAALTGGSARQSKIAAAPDGRLRFEVDGAGHQISITGPGAGNHLPVLLPVSRGGVLRVAPGSGAPLPIRVYNPRTVPLRNVRVELETEYPTVTLQSAATEVAEIPSGGIADLSSKFLASFIAGSGDFAHARIVVRLDGAPATIDLLIAPESPPTPAAVEILDGRTITLPVFRQKGNQGGGAAIQRTITEGKGNGNGKLEPGEEATIWVQIVQGLDPFDKGNWYRARVYTDSPWVEETARLEEQKQREWTSARELTSVVRLKETAPTGTPIPVLLSNESWSFHFTPDARYGVEPLYQAFQLHRNHVHRHVIHGGAK